MPKKKSVNPKTEHFFEYNIMQEHTVPILQRKCLITDDPNGQIPVKTAIDILIKMVRLFGGRG